MSNLTNTTPEEDTYVTLKQDLLALLNNENNFITILANASSLIYHKLKDINWVGFYLLYNNELKLGPFQGKVACQSIPVGKGVCGFAVSTKSVLLVNDVHGFNGHIACDSATNSEIVLPLIIKQQIIGVLDIDSPLLNRFNNQDQQNLEDLVNILCQKLNHTNIVKFLQKY